MDLASCRETLATRHAPRTSPKALETPWWSSVQRLCDVPSGSCLCMFSDKAAGKRADLLGDIKNSARQRV